MRPQIRTVEHRIARVTERTYGIATHEELLAAGLSRGQIKRCARNGVLEREYRGVYRSGPRSYAASCMAAVKACGKGAALAGMAAAHWMRLLEGEAPAAEVVAPSEHRIEGMATRRSRRIERWTFDGIPTTTVARTLVDVAARLDDDELAYVFHRAQTTYRTTPQQVEEMLRRHPGSPGAAGLRRAIGGDTHVSLSRLEGRFLQRLREAGLPLPDETNRYAGSKRVDCRWTRQRLTVELDSYRFHNSRYSWEQDRRREREAYARGDDHRRYTWGDVFEDAAPMLSELRALL